MVDGHLGELPHECVVLQVELCEVRWDLYYVCAASGTWHVLVLSLRQRNIESMTKLMEQNFNLFKSQVLQLLPRQVSNHVSNAMLVKQLATAPLRNRWNILHLRQSGRLTTSLEEVHYDGAATLNINLKQHSLFHHFPKIKRVDLFIYNLPICNNQRRYNELSARDFLQH